MRAWQIEQAVREYSRKPGDEPMPLIAIRRPTNAEIRTGAEIVFIRCYRGDRITIFAATEEGSWRQWGAAQVALAANALLVEHWRRGRIPGFAPDAPDDP